MKAATKIQTKILNSSIKKIILRLQFLITCLIIFASTLFSQERKGVIKFGGSANISDNFYSANGIDPRQPDNMLTGIFRANITLFDQIQLPFELYLSTQQTRFQQPFNQFGVSPRISNWLTLHGGYFSTQLSDLSFGDLRMLGGGFELTPGNFRLKGLYGRTRQATDASIENYMPDIYRQHAYAVSIGYGDESKTFINLNFFHAVDDSGSIKSDSAKVTPNENLVSTVSFGVRFSPKIHVKGEAGLSVFSANTAADKLENFSAPSFFFTPNISSRTDGAAKLNINIMPSNSWSVILSSQWIGPGFTTLGYALMPNDVLEFTLSPNARLFKNKLNLRSRAGIRMNNLRGNRLSTTSRFTGSFAANWQVNKKFGLDANYNNNVIQSAHVNDTLRLSNIFSSYSLSPRFLFDGFGGTNNLIFTYSFQDVSDKNAYTSVITDNRSHSLSTIHSLTFLTSWSFTTTILYNSAKLSTFNTRIVHISETVGRRFFNNKLTLSASTGMNFIKTTSKDSQLVFRLNAAYTLNKFGNLSFNISNSNYNGTGITSQSYNELYGSIQYSINF